MLLKLILISLAVASVTYACVPGASPNADGDCQCQAGLTGNPDLCCYDPISSRGCHVSGDPVLTSFSGNKIGLDFPCGTMISSSQFDAQSCVINVYAAGKDIGGTIYTSQVKIQIRQFSVVTLTFNFESSPFLIHFEKTAGAEDFTMADGEDKYMSADGIIGDIVISYHAPLHMFVVHAGGIQVNVRPSLGNDPEMGYNPGVCVMEPVESLSPSPGSTYSCSLNNDVTDGPVGEYLEYAIQPMKNYIFNNGILKDTTSSQMTDKCQLYQNILINECDAADRYNALKKCSFILFQSVIRRCFKEGGANVMDYFNQCLDTYCQGTQALCESLKTNAMFQACSPSLSDCETWAPYRRENSFIAGEGGDNFLNAGGDESGGSNAPTTEFNFDIFGNDGGNNNNNAGGVDDGFVPPF